MEGAKLTSGGQWSFNWDVLIPMSVHPVKVAIIEALQWIAVPLSPKELDRIFDDEYGVSLVSYHMRTLAKVGVVERVRQQAVRGAVQSFYTLAAREPASPSLHCE
jgi:hypothetical protein